DHKRNGPPEVEDRTPTESRNQPEGDEARYHGAGREAGTHDDYGGNSDAWRTILADESHRVRHDAVQTQPCDEADHQQFRYGLDARGKQRDNREEKTGPDQHWAAADAIRKHAQQNRTEQNAH